MRERGHYEATGSAVVVPLMSREAWANAIGLPLAVVRAQCKRGHWPCVKVGKYSLVNVEAIRLRALERATEFVL